MKPWLKVALAIAAIAAAMLFGRFVHLPPTPQGEATDSAPRRPSLVERGLRLALDAAQARETAALRRAQLTLDSLAIARKTIAALRVREQAHDDSARAAWQLADSLERQIGDVPDSTRRLITTLRAGGDQCFAALNDCQDRGDALAHQVLALEARIQELVGLGSRCGLRLTANGPGGGVLVNGQPVLLLGSITIGSCRLR